MDNKGRLIATLFGCLVAFVGAEVSLRILSRFSPDVEFIATAGMKKPVPVFSTLEDYVSARPTQLYPHRNWFNYFNNAFGFNDQEFDEHAPPETRRILALGDSFVYGLSPYPMNVMTHLERLLSEQCDCPVEILNAGVASTGVWDYQQVFRLMVDRFHPHEILLHFYFGNDGPDLVNGKSDIPDGKVPVFQSYAVRAIKNGFRLLRGVKVDSHNFAVDDPQRNAANSTAGILPRGGMQAEEGKDLLETASVFQGPTFSDSAYDETLAEEVMRFALVDESRELATWQPILSQFEELGRQALERGLKVVVVGYPSRLQLDSQLFDRAVADCQQLRKRCRELKRAQFDATRPNRFLKAELEKRGFRFVDLTPAMSEHYATHAQTLYMRNDTHWTPQGNALAAFSEAKALR